MSRYRFANFTKNHLACAACSAALLAGCGGAVSLSFGGPGYSIGLGVVIPPERDDPPPTAAVTRDLSSQNFASWSTVLGDGISALPGEAPVSASDVQTTHSASSTLLTSNVAARQIQAHNLTYFAVADALALQRKHVASYEFRLPYVPTADNSATLRGQTVEGGLFIWDGANTRRDVGAAFQWRVNPLRSDYGKLYTWRADGSSRFWQEVGRITPGTEWHRLRVEIDPVAGRAALAIDDIVDNNALAREAPPGFGSDVAARLQIQTISAEPVANTAARKQQAEFRNWRWQWLQ
jgi:hypothetical protein